MKTKITISIFLICLGFNFVHSQFTTNKPDLRLCGTAPNYYQDYYNCTSNNYTLDDVFLSLTDVNGVPLNNTTCTPGVPETMYVMLNYTSNSNSNINHARMFADLIIDGVVTPLNVHLGTVAPGAGQRLLYGPFTWVCGQEMILDRILIVWKTNGNNTELVPYTCSTYNRSQCEFPTTVIITAPLAVQFEYSGCTNGAISTINFDSTTNGGTPPYSYAWDFDSNGTTDSTLENPTFVYNNSSSNTATLTVTDSMGLTNTYSVPIVYPSEVIVNANVQGLTCVPGSTALIDLTISGGTAPYSVLWNTGATSQDLSNLGIGTYSATITDALGCIKNYSTTISAIVCCEFLVTCPTFSPISLQCYDLLPQATSLTELEFEALGNGDGIIGNNPCGVIQITASNSAYLGCNTQVTRTYTITEYLDANDNGIRDAGENTILNVVTCTQIFTINDTTDPTITTQAANLEVQCDGAGNTAQLNAWLASNGGAVASDVCSNVTWTNNFASVSDTCGATGSATVTFTATDNCGNASTTSATFTIIDDTDPTITTQAANLEVQCDGSGNTAQLNAWLASNGGAVASDVCSNVTWTNNFASVSDTCGATGSATVTFTATDNCGNSSTTSATFTIIDDTDPTITTQASNLEVQCDGAGNTAQLNAWLASNGGAVASDVCSNVTWSNNFASVSDTCGATGSATVTFTATDNCGNASTTSATFTIIDDTDPTITTQASNLEVQCDGSGNTAQLNAWLASNGGAVASDVCSNVTWSNNFASVSDTCGATGSAMVTFTATDDCGNASTTSATFTIIDDTDPTITTQATNLEVQCDGSGNTAQLNAWLASNGGAVASDVCSNVTWSNNFASVSDTCGATGSATVTFTATDNCGNASTTSATFTIIDDTDPTITTQASNLEVQCDGSGNTAQLNAWLASNGGAVASDVCSNVTWSNNFASVSDTCGATGSAMVTFTATDDCGNASTTSATFTIIDDTDPTITTQATNLEVQCDGSGNTAQLNAWLASNGGAVASDVCSNVTWSNNFTSVSDTCGATGSATVTFTATDDCGNASTTSATFTIIDDTDPTITTQATNLEVQCDGSGNTAQLNAWLASNGGAVASDVCSNVTWSNNFTSVSDTCGATGSATVTFTATDDCGNASTTSATFTIIDDTDPTITTQASNLEVQCDGSGNTAQLNAWLASNGGAVASDVCSNVTWTNNFTSVSDTCGTTGSATVTFTATDDCGNASTTSATFTIIDDTDPTITTQASNLEVQCDGNGNTAQLNAWLASNGGAVASDVCSNVTWSNNFASVSDTCGATGSATVTFTATDACGNASTTSATFTIIDDTDPTITTQASNLEVQCDGAGNTAQLNAWLASNGGAVASDVCSNVTWSNNFASVSDTCGATGSATVTFTATDDCGNSSTTSATFTIIDDTDPTITTQASNLEVQCDGAGNTAQLNAWLASNGGAVASDVCSNVTWSNNFASVSDTCGATGSAMVTFTAIDDCGNASTTSATFTIIDDTDPTITTQASNLEVQCDGAGNTAQLNAWLASNGGAVASDVCSNVTWTNNFASVSDTCGATGSATVTFTATDNCGNASTTSATFTIIDDTDPTITTQAANLEVQCDGAGNTAQLNAWLASNGGAVASDVCSNVTWTNNFTSVSDTCGATGSATVTFTATDDCGNSSTTSATFTIIDDTDPIFTSELPQDISVSCDAIPNPANMSGSDNCGEVTITVLDTIDREESQCEGEYIISRTWTITDSCNNSSSYTQTITVFDNTPPILTTPLDAQISVLCSEIPEIPQLVFTDNCSGIQDVVYNETSTIISIYAYVIVREWVVSDNCGNEASFTQTINVSVEEPFDAIPFAICIEENPIDLFTILDDSIPTNGTWQEVTNSGGLTGSIFNPSNVALGYYTLQYIVELEDNACPMIYEIYLNVNDDCVVLPACDITVYNAVSPNDDSSNDFFFIDGLECYPNNTVEIYNRWGILVYDERGYDNNLKSFKGISEGRNTVNKNELLPDGTYFYILKYTDEENKNHDRSGYLYLNR